jgi:hypothetical protein
MNHSVPSPSFSPRHIPPPPPINHQQARAPAPVSSHSAAHQQPPRYVHRDISSPNLLSPHNQTVSSPPSATGLRLGTAVNSPLSSPHGGILSPQSAVSTHSPMAMRGPSGGGPVVGYNPQQWGAHGPSGGAFIPHSAMAPTARPANPEDGIAEPPPPYSHEPSTQSTPTPPPAQQSRPTLPYVQTSNSSHQHPSMSNYITPASAVSLVSPAASMLRNGMTPINPQPMNFPPPPGAPGGRDRSVSRSGRSRFGLSALARGISSDRSMSHTPEPPIVQSQAPALTIPRPRPVLG